MALTTSKSFLSWGLLSSRLKADRQGMQNLRGRGALMNTDIKNVYALTSPFGFCFLFLRATPAAYGSFPARGQIGAAAAGQYHSYSTTR